MFGTVMEFLALSLFATLFVGGLLIGKKYLQLVNVKSDTELERAKTVRDHHRHDRQINEHQNQLKLLALTAGPATDEKKSDDEVEVVKLGKKDIQEPGISYREYTVHERDRRDAVDAEYIPLRP